MAARKWMATKDMRGCPRYCEDREIEIDVDRPLNIRTNSTDHRETVDP